MTTELHFEFVVVDFSHGKNGLGSNNMRGIHIQCSLLREIYRSKRTIEFTTTRKKATTFFLWIIENHLNRSKFIIIFMKFRGQKESATKWLAIFFFWNGLPIESK